MLRLDSLSKGAFNLNEVKPNYPKSSIADDTETSINIGVLLGIENEINGFINNYKNENLNFTCLTIYDLGLSNDHFVELIHIQNLYHFDIRKLDYNFILDEKQSMEIFNNIESNKFNEDDIDHAITFLKKRLDIIPEELHSYLIDQYSNPAL